jgi:hypothetical protein
MVDLKAEYEIDGYARLIDWLISWLVD